MYKYSVHPRLRGELNLKPLQRRFALGSSPLARGTHLRRHRHSAGARFIPACAGNSLCPRLNPEFVSVHPRLRGELALKRCKACRVGGSSPLARGTHERQPQETQSERFIPACAGNSRRNTFFLLPRPVHPRLRGELFSNVLTIEPSYGSSPLARGTPGPHR